MAKYNAKNDITFESIDYVYDKYKIIRDDFYGYTSTIFKYKKDKLLKIFENPISNFTYHTLNFINKLKTKVSAKIHNYVNIDGDRIGYIIDEMPGRNLLEIPVNTNVRDFITSMKEVEDDVRLLSKNHVVTEDLKPANLMYDIRSNKSSIIDEDCYIRLKDDSTELITINNLTTLYLSILETLVYPTKGAIDEEFFNELVAIILNNYDFSVPIDVFYDYILDEIEGFYDREVKTIGDIRKVLRNK